MAVPKNHWKCKSATISLHRGDSLNMSCIVCFWATVEQRHLYCHLSWTFTLLTINDCRQIAGVCSPNQNQEPPLCDMLNIDQFTYLLILLQQIIIRNRKLLGDLDFVLLCWCTFYRPIGLHQTWMDLTDIVVYYVLSDQQNVKQWNKSESHQSPLNNWGWYSKKFGHRNFEYHPDSKTTDEPNLQPIF